MTDEANAQQRLRVQMEGMFINELTNAGNQAVDMGLILSHSYHRGQYEILTETGLTQMAPHEALSYLKNLIAEAQAANEQ